MTAAGKAVCEFGEWDSPITAQFITSAGIGLSNPKCSPAGDIFWLESRPQEAGRNVICRRDPAEILKSQLSGGFT
jgi:hypothetical protein